MDLYIARQPIFDRNLEVFGYELLYRSSRENRYAAMDADEASSSVIINAFTVLGLENLTGGKRAFVNFTDRLLKERVATLFPKDLLVVEVLEDVVPDREIRQACADFREKGYLVALDDFIYRPDLKPLVELADIIKVDFTLLGERERQSVVRVLGNGRIRFLAEKVETQEEFEKAKAWGYTLFQGYFFSKPVIQPVGEIPPMRLNQLRLLEALNRPDVEFDAVTEIVSQDVSLSYKLLRLINSPAIGRPVRIDSIRQALVMLGQRELKKWLSLIVLRGIASHKPDELVRSSLIRAKLLETIGADSKLPNAKEELFLLGLFSQLDAMMDRPLAELLGGLNMPDAIKTGLLQGEGMYGMLFELVCHFERGDWGEVARICALLGQKPERLTPIWCKAVEWCAGVLEQN